MLPKIKSSWYYSDVPYQIMGGDLNRLESMSTLVAAVEAGSLSAASRKLGVPLATVSRKVLELEAHLKTRLVNRTSRRLTLTDAGQSYVAACKRILGEIEEAEHTVTGEYRAPRGDLAITAPIVFGRLHVLPVVAEFLKAYPDIDIRLVLLDRPINLFEEHIDLALRIGVLPDSSHVAVRLGEIRVVTCASPAYLAARGVPQKPSELATHDCITRTEMASPEFWTFKSGSSEISVPIRSRLVVNTAEAAIDAAVASIGITRVLSYQAESAIRAGTLAVALQEFEPEPWPVSLMRTGQPLLPLKVRAFLDFATPRLKAKLS
jgi:DNA-binding transcriptional LysR family regulator